jgi:hypothetical protein
VFDSNLFCRLLDNRPNGPVAQLLADHPSHSSRAVAGDGLSQFAYPKRSETKAVIKNLSAEFAS